MCVCSVLAKKNLRDPPRFVTYRGPNHMFPMDSNALISLSLRHEEDEAPYAGTRGFGSILGTAAGLAGSEAF